MAFTNEAEILNTEVMSKWVIRTWPKVNHSLFNKLGFKISKWFPEGNMLPAQSLGFPLWGILPGVAHLSLFWGKVILSSVREVSNESLDRGTLW